MRPDVIVIGAGAAGCVLAARLSADPTRQVLLIEAGGSDWNPVLRVPIMAGVLLRQPYGNWLSDTEPEDHLDGRRIAWPRGKVIGGSTSINGMIWHRGRPSDFDRWAEVGLRDWAWPSVLPHFRALERHDRGPSDDHGAAGPVPVTEGRGDNPLHEAFLAACEQAGHRRSDNYNAPPHEGAGRYFFTIANGERWSAARTFLKPARGRRNLHVLKRALVSRILVENGRAAGVVVQTGAGEQRIMAGSVVLAAGAIGTPQILMLSGIGPAAELAAHGIDVVLDRAGVGENLQDHLSTRVLQACTRPVTLHGLTRADRAAMAFLQAAILRRGVGTTMPIGSGLHARSTPELGEPDIQSFFTPSHSQATVRLPFWPLAGPIPQQHCYSLSFYVMRPESRGHVRLRDADPRSAPLIRPRYLTSGSDRRKIHAALALARDVLAQRAFDAYRGPELSPGADIRTPGDVDRWIASTAGSAYHPVGTCRMGQAGDPAAVVDGALNVIGIDGLKIADASVMPFLTSGNTMAPTMMIAHRCAEFIAAGR